MGLKCGIVGLPNVGKSTLFNALSNAKAEAANYPFCTIEPNVGIVTVPDERLEALAEIVKPQRVVPAIIEFVDIAGLVKGASKGEGLGNQFLSHIRQVDAIIHVVRCFEDQNIVHVSGKVDPVADKEIIDTELQLRDLESVEKKIAKVQRAAKSGEAKSKKELAALEKFKSILEQGKNIRQAQADEEEWEAIKDLFLLTQKPVIYAANIKETDLARGTNQHVERLKEAVRHENAQVIVICAALEAQIAALDDPHERKLFLKEYGLKKSGLDQLIRASYDLLNLITYFTAGEKEVRAWTIHRGWKAPQAAGIIHSDFERGFIKAEVIKLADFVKYRSEAACREAGKIAIEGKDYIVQDGDIMHFRFNV